MYIKKYMGKKEYYLLFASGTHKLWLWDFEFSDVSGC